MAIAFMPTIPGCAWACPYLPSVSILNSNCLDPGSTARTWVPFPLLPLPNSCASSFPDHFPQPAIQIVSTCNKTDKRQKTNLNSDWK